ncbi:MAG TPA: hypothetical protein DCO86_04685, partial [Spirochaetaceae bacterium]|nr:hypothetical protein [Spirochaetaceae bacterium]
SSGEQSGGSDSTPWNGGVASGEIAYSLLVPFDGDFREIVYGNIGLDLKGAHDCYIDSSTGKSEYYSDNIHLLFRKGSEETDVVKGDNYIFLTYATNNGSERTIKSTYYASLEPGYLAYRVGAVNKDSKDGKFSVEWSGNWTSESKGDEVYRFIKTLFYMDCDVQTVFNMFYGDSTLDFRLNQLANKWEYTFHQTPQEEVKNTAQYWLCGIYKNKEDNDYLKGYDITVKYTNFVQGMCELDFKKTGVDGSEASLYISHTDKVTRPTFPEASYAFFGDCEEGDMYTSTGLYAASKGNATGLHGNSIKHEHYIEIGDIDDYVAMVENEKSNNPNKKSRALVLFYDGYDYDYDYLMDDAMPSCCNADRIEEEGSDAMCGGDNLMPYWTLMMFSSGNKSDSTLWREKLDSDVRTFVVQVDGAKYKYASKKGGASVTASSQIIKDYSFLENFSSKSWYSGKENESYYENRMNFGFAELYSWLKYWSMDKNIPIYDNGNYMLNKENTGLTDEEKFELVNDIEEIKISRRVCNGAKNNFEDEFAFQLLNLCKYDWGGFADSKYEAIKRMNLETWLRKDNRGSTIQGVNGKNGIGEKVDRNAKFREPALVLFEDGVPVRAIGHCYLGHWKAQPFIKGEYNTWQAQLQDVEVINKK